MGTFYVPNTGKSFQRLATDLYGRETNLQNQRKTQKSHGTKTARYCYEKEKKTQRGRERERGRNAERERENVCKERVKAVVIFVLFNWGKGQQKPLSFLTCLW